MKNSISFGANYLQNTTVKKYNPATKNYTPHEVSFVEIIPTNNNDKNAVKQLTREWYDCSLIQNIWEDVLECRSEAPRIEARFFAITTQKKGLKNPDATRILGIVEMGIDNPKNPRLEYLQVHPDMIQQFFETRYKHIGTGILNVLKNMYSSITLSSRASATDFYYKNGFELIDPVLLKFRWIKK